MPSSRTANEKCPHCSKVRKHLSQKSWNQHLQYHLLPDKWCDLCKISRKRSGWSNHIKSEKHQENVARLAVSTNDQGPNTLDKILSISNGPLSHLMSILRMAISRYGGISTLSAPPVKPGSETPVVFSSKETWTQKPAYNDFMTGLLDGFRIETTKIYMRGKPHEPCLHSPIFDVIEQLNTPQIAATYYATNMTCKVAQLRIPERLLGNDPVYQDDEILTTTNMTPKYTFVDLHIDHGKHVVTTLHGGCVKLWVLYPPSNANLEWLKKYYDFDNIFTHLWDKLEGGQFTITSDSALYEYQDTISLPPGWIHGTLTLEGGLVPGLEFTTAACLEVAAAVFNINSAAFLIGKDDSRPFLEAVVMGLRSNDKEKQELAAILFCQNQKILLKSKASLLDKVRKLQGSNCKACNKPWKFHQQ